MSCLCVHVCEGGGSQVLLVVGQEVSDGMGAEK